MKKDWKLQKEFEYQASKYLNMICQIPAEGVRYSRHRNRPVLYKPCGTEYLLEDEVYCEKWKDGTCEYRNRVIL